MRVDASKFEAKESNWRALRDIFVVVLFSQDARRILY